MDVRRTEDGGIEVLTGGMTFATYEDVEAAQEGLAQAHDKAERERQELLDALASLQEFADEITEALREVRSLDDS